MNRIRLKKNITNQNNTLNIDIEKQFDNEDIIHLCGKSGAGKTSILEMIAGIAKPDEGIIEINGISWYNSLKKQNIDSTKRNVGLVFQDYVLFPNMDVLQNILFGVKNNFDKDYLHQLIELTEINELQKRKPDKLSGGEQQRVALVRTLIRKPQLLLLDEPFSALDEKMRTRIQEYLFALNKKDGVTIILVSHTNDKLISESKLKKWHLIDGKIRE